MTISKFISALVLAAATVLPAVAASGRDPITTEQIAAAMANVGMQVSAKQVELLSDVVATTPAPTLKIRSMEPWGDHRMMVRLACAQSEECLPFFVAVRFNQGGEKPAAPATSTETAPPISSAAASTTAASSTAASNQPTIRAGANMILLMDGNHIHIKLSVISLENGSAGQTIRVSSQDRRQVYTAQIVDGTLLRASL